MSPLAAEHGAALRSEIAVLPPHKGSLLGDVVSVPYVLAALKHGLGRLLADVDLRTAEAGAFLRELWPKPPAAGSLVIFTLPDKAARRFPVTDAGLREAAEVAVTLSDQEQNVYIGMGTTRSTAGRGAEADVTALPGAWMDLDARGPTHKSESLPPSSDEAHQMLGATLPEPTVVLDSGGGLQAFWLSETGPWYPEAVTVTAGLQHALRERFAGVGWSLDDTADATRVLRVPGTWNWKAVHAGVEAEPRPVRLLSASGPRYTPGELSERFPAPAAPKPRVGVNSAPEDEVLADRKAKLEWWVQAAGLGEYAARPDRGDGKVVAELERCPFDPADHSAPWKAVIGRGSDGGWFAKCQAEQCGGGKGPNRWADIRHLAPIPTFHDVHEALGWEFTGDWAGDWVSKRSLGIEEDGEILVLAESPEALAAELAPLRQVEAMRGWIRGTDIEASDVEWLWDGRLPRGKLVLLAGDPGDGKSFMSLGIAAAVTRGTGLPHQKTAEPGTVLILAQEDGHSDTVKPRLERMGADHERYFVRAVEEPITVNDAALVESTLAFLRDTGKPVSLLVIDPWMGFLTGGVNTWKDNELRAAVQPWIDMAGRHEVTILALVHLNKGDTKPLYRIMGSVASPALARAALLTGKTPDGKMALAVAKSNLAVKAATLEFEVVDVDGPGTNSGVVHWGDERPDVTAEDLGSRNPGGEQRRDSAVSEAERFLRRHLENGEWHPAARVIEVADQDGISKSTLKRAAKHLLVEKEQRTIPGPWFWRLDPEWEA